MKTEISKFEPNQSELTKKFLKILRRIGKTICYLFQLFCFIPNNCNCYVYIFQLIFIFPLFMFKIIKFIDIQRWDRFGFLKNQAESKPQGIWRTLNRTDLISTLYQKRAEEQYHLSNNRMLFLLTIQSNKFSFSSQEVHKRPLFSLFLCHLIFSVWNKQKQIRKETNTHLKY